MPSTLDELLAEFAQVQSGGRRFAAEEIVAAVIHLESRQAEAMALVLWALPLDVVAYYVRRNDVGALARREGYSLRAAGRQLGISHKCLSELVERGKKNVLAWLLTPNVG